VDAALRYAFIDESGTAGIELGSRFLVVAALSANRPREIELPIRRALKKLGQSLKTGEIKASRASEKTTLRLLETIAGRDVDIAAVIVDQRLIAPPPADSEEIYRMAVTRAVHLLVERFPNVEVCLDKRYTREPLRYELEKRIRQGLAGIPHQVVLIRQESSHTRKELQAADAVAWAFFQKYERRDPRFYDVIASKILAEEQFERKKWR